MPDLKTDIATSPIFRPIKLERVSEKVASQLKEAITEGKFRMGDRLPAERELAEQMGVSRPSVREALQQLELLGLIESVHGGGTIVKSLTEKEIQSPIEILLGEDVQKVVELTEVRALLEAWAAKQAANNRTDEELELMQSYLRQMEQDLNKGRVRADIDYKFHTEIAAASHNTIFLHLMQTIHQLVSYSVKLNRELLFLAREDQETIFDHHTRVFQAIRNRDSQAAEAAMNEHLHFVMVEYKARFLSRSE
jgi:GntR family transcriptional regulator, transcriptional repressor for pyruvate dehydrogenase complex